MISGRTGAKLKPQKTEQVRKMGSLHLGSLYHTYVCLTVYSFLISLVQISYLIPYTEEGMS